MNATSGRCKKFAGQDDDETCMEGPRGVCVKGAALQRRYNVKQAPTEQQLAALAKARLARKAKAAAKKALQVGGGCRLNQSSGRCKNFPGQDDDETCMKGPHGVCAKNVTVRRQYAVKLPATAKQLAALAKANAKRKANAAAKKALRQVGGCGMPQVGGCGMPQVGGGCRLYAPTKRCRQAPGQEDDGVCMKGPHGVCAKSATVRRQYNVKRPATAKQLAALAKARAARRANALAKKRV